MKRQGIRLLGYFGSPGRPHLGELVPGAFLPSCSRTQSTLTARSQTAERWRLASGLLPFPRLSALRCSAAARGSARAAAEVAHVNKLPDPERLL